MGHVPNLPAQQFRGKSRIGDYGDKLYISFQGATSGVQIDFHLSTQTIGGGTITGIESVSWVEGSAP